MTTRQSSQAGHFAVFELLFFFLCRGSFCATYVDHLSVGFNASALQFVDVNNFFLYSINQTFALGFCSLGAGDRASYYLCISHASSQTTVWYANRNQPIQRSDSFYFKSDGSLAIENSTGTVIWSSVVGGGNILQLQEEGNLILFSRKSEVLWQSFDHPTDTILTGQSFNANMALVGSKSTSDISEGSFYMTLDGSGLALYDNSSPPLRYWTMANDGKNSQLTPGGHPAYAKIVLDALELVEEDGKTVVSEVLLDNYVGYTIRRATLEHDGNLKVYFFSGSLWNPAFAAVRNDCDLPSACGAYGLCGDGRQCTCPKASTPINSTVPSQGCAPNYAPTCPNSSNVTKSAVGMAYVGAVDYYGNDDSQAQGAPDLDACKRACLDNCSCTALFFYNDTRSCFLWGEVGTLKYISNTNHLAFLKAPLQDVISLPNQPKKRKASYVIIFIAIGTACIIAGLVLGAWWLHKRRLAGLMPPHDDDDDLIEPIPGLPTRFSYKELEAATNAFRVKLGSGGFGSVYEGLLPDRTKIAVKRLESVGQGKKEFWAEVATIGSIHHVHLVQLRGFCAEGSHRLLVYEFMANGSLANVLFSANKGDIVLDWETRCKVSIATARGLAYLHDDCRERIIHCDIKPENILLDESFVAKVADFGLAKLMSPEQSEVFTTLRGTRGYLAPEWLLNSSISDKSDVYSFGMVLLEIISGRKNFDPTAVSDKMYFPIYAFRQVGIGNSQELADAKLNGQADKDQLATLSRIALWCIQDEVARRPSMRNVVKMIEGIIQVPQPPSSPQLAVRLHCRKFDSGNESGISDFDSGGISASRLSGPR